MKKDDIPHDEVIDRLKSGDLSRRDFNRVLAAAGIAMVATPMLPGKARAAAADQPTYFTWGGWDDPARA
ncbi:MAG: twin-arginine translocation signal domain-containing protein [Gammaproteobacteria bacterium]|nr:twin-arginine translocation signal domain-containing protein [Gammaproteobacteria bacterium]